MNPLSVQSQVRASNLRPGMLHRNHSPRYQTRAGSHRMPSVMSTEYPTLGPVKHSPGHGGNTPSKLKARHLTLTNLHRIRALAPRPAGASVRLQ